MKDLLCWLGIMKKRTVTVVWAIGNPSYSEYVWCWEQFKVHDFEKPMPYWLRRKLLPPWLREGD